MENAHWILKIWFEKKMHDIYTDYNFNVEMVMFWMCWINEFYDLNSFHSFHPFFFFLNEVLK